MELFAFCLFSLSLIIISCPSIRASDGPTVQLSLGKVTGTTIKPELVDYFAEKGGKVRNVFQFLGIPFATPPIGGLRFKKPEPVQKWAPKELMADKFGASCLQAQFAGINEDVAKLFSVQGDFSEDCLFLNIWTPTLPKEGSNENLKSVYVWIHGGGFMGGSASGPMYDGAILAATQDMVVVTINYRLGALGFLVSPDGVSAPGNAGMWDQVMALEWIQDHIKYFGGDSNQVTIAGESAGGMSVSGLFLSPSVRGLFNNVITMSGSALTNKAFRERKSQIPKTEKLAETANCPINDHKLMMDCLMKVEGDKLLVKDNELLKTFPDQDPLFPFMLFGPIYGDDLFPAKTSELLRNVNYDRKNVRVLTGVVNWEGGIMMFVDENVISRKLNESNDPIEPISDWLINSVKIDPRDAKMIAETYLYREKLNIEPKDAIFDMMADPFLVCPSYYENEAISKNVKSVKSYVFTYKSTKNELINQICPGKGLVCHGFELGFFFGSTLLKSFEDYNDQNDFEQAMQTINLLGQFVRNEKMDLVRKTKDGKIEKVDWPEFSPEKKLAVNLNHLKNNHVVSDFRGSFCNLWKKYLV